MTPKERKRLQKLIYKHYWENGQHICLATSQIMDEKSSYLDVYLLNTKTKEIETYLFEIKNYNAYRYIERDYSDRFYEIFDSIGASNTPLYINKEFLLPKFTGITVDDILKKARYFITKELKMWGIFNYKFYKGTEDGYEEQR